MRPFDDVEEFHRFLRDQGLVFACAESCTGGLIAQQMTSRAGSSQVFWGGAVTYSNEAKVRFLQVPETEITVHGAVSGPVALAMVQGTARVSGVSLAAATTGIAGPDGGTSDKPVGTVWFGLWAQRNERSGSVAVRHQFRGGRNRIQRQAAVWARTLARLWWESGMDLDRFLSLVDNRDKPFVEASHSLPVFRSGPL